MNSSTLALSFAAFLVTLIAHCIAKILAKKIPMVPMVVSALFFVVLILFIIQWEYQSYYAAAKPIFDHLLGYVTVLLAIPLASMDLKGLPLKRLSFLLGVSSLIGALLPMFMAYVLVLSHSTILAFATRAVTTPIGLSIATIIGAPLTLANLIIIISGFVGAAFARVICKNIDDDRAQGLAMGVMAHAFGTIEAWQISPTAGRYAAFGLAINGLLTAIWVPILFSLL